MNDDERQKCAKRLKTALELADSGIALQRAKLRRNNPDATDSQIHLELRAWLHDRPGAEHGDSAGHVVEFTDTNS